MKLDVERYLQRIGYSGSTAPTERSLRAIHRAHLISVPFENLSVRGGEPIPLDEEALFEKIVVRRRGGFCYALNGLFASLLEGLGFRVARLAGRVGVPGIAFDHLALRVDLERPWLADVGFGDSFLDPLHLDAGTRNPAGTGAATASTSTATASCSFARKRRAGCGSFISRSRVGRCPRSSPDAGITGRLHSRRSRRRRWSRAPRRPAASRSRSAG